MIYSSIISPPGGYKSIFPENYCSIKIYKPNVLYLDNEDYVLYPNTIGLYNKHLWSIFLKEPYGDMTQAITGVQEGLVYYDKSIYKYKYGDRDYTYDELPQEDLTGYEYVEQIQDNPIRMFALVNSNAELIFDNYPVPIGLNTDKPWYKVNTLASGNGLIYSNPEASKTPLFTTKYGNSDDSFNTNGVIGTIIDYDWKAHNYVYIENNTPKYINPTFSCSWSD